MSIVQDTIPLLFIVLIFSMVCWLSVVRPLRRDFIPTLGFFFVFRRLVDAPPLVEVSPCRRIAVTSPHTRSRRPHTRQFDCRLSSARGYPREFSSCLVPAWSLYYTTLLQIRLARENRETIGSSLLQDSSEPITYPIAPYIYYVYIP